MLDTKITAKKAIINMIIAMLSGGSTYLLSLPPEHQMGGAMLLMVVFKMAINILSHSEWVERLLEE